MTKLETLLSRIEGTYTNTQQTHTTQLPCATHIVTPCNNCIKDLPKDFTGIFVIDETYYQYDDHSMELHHLYCYQEVEEGIQLLPYTLPANIKEVDFTKDKVTSLSFTQILPKADFPPILYTLDKDVYKSEGTSEITPGLMLQVVMNIYPTYYTVVEACYQKDVLVSGFKEPVIYSKQQGL